VQIATIPVRGGSMTGACCTDDGRCGFSLAGHGVVPLPPDGCLAVDQPGVPDVACVDTSVPAGGGLDRLLKGCCRPSGVCGFEMPLLDGVTLGCVDARAWLLPALAVPCKGKPTEGDAG
jgi:hypothetical protein